MEEEYKPKSKIIAVILNIIAIGAGYLYVGKFNKLLLIYPLLTLISWFFYYISTIYPIGYMVLLHYGIFIFVYLYASYDVIKIISKREDKNIKQNKNIFVFLFVIVFYISLVLILMLSPIKKYKVPSGGMKSTIIINDQIIVTKDNKNILRGNIIVFMYPKNPAIHYVKRCVAKGGDIIALNNKNLFLLPKEGDKYVKNNYPTENIIKIKDKLWVVNPYKLKYKGIHNNKNVIKKDKYIKALFDMEPILVPDNHFFVMGDNRDHSNDSRFWGTVPKEYVIGKVKSIYINFSNLSRTGMIIK
jgi:signal peptidase I